MDIVMLLALLLIGLGLAYLLGLIKLVSAARKVTISIAKIFVITGPVGILILIIGIILLLITTGYIKT